MRGSLIIKNKDLYDELYAKYKVLNSRNKNEIESFDRVESLTYSQNVVSSPFKSKILNSPGRRPEKSNSQVTGQEVITNQFSLQEVSFPSIQKSGCSPTSKLKNHIIYNEILEKPNKENINHQIIKANSDHINILDDRLIIRNQKSTELKGFAAEKQSQIPKYRKKFKHVLSKKKIAPKIFECCQEYERNQANEQSEMFNISILPPITPITKIGSPNIANLDFQDKHMRRNSQFELAENKKKRILGCLPFCF